MRTHSFFFRALALSLCLFTGCASTPTLPPPLASATSLPAAPAGFWVPLAEARAQRERTRLSDGVIRPGELLRLTSGSDRQLQGDFRVDRDGVLKLPYQVSLSVAGLDFKAAAVRAAEAYRPYFKADPGIRLQRARRQYWVSVQGLVAQPGDFLVDPFESLDRVLAKAKGLDREARYVQVTGGANGNTRFFVDLQEYNQGRFSDLLPRWEGGETLTVLQAGTALTTGTSQGIELLGEVRTPGGLSFDPGADFYSYLVRAGGPSPQADLGDVQVIRETATGRAVVSSSAERIARDLKLDRGDIVIVGAARPGGFERGMQLGTTIAAILSAIGIFFVVR